jgi:preprotein translocase subunit SecD
MGELQLQYGIELDGGARLRAPIVGVTAENVSVSPEEANALESELASELGVEPIDVRVRMPEQDQQRRRAVQRGATVEATSRNVTQDELRAALDSAGYPVSAENVRDGVTDRTREEMIQVIENKIDEAGLSGGSVQEARTATGDTFIVIEAPNRDADQLQALLEERGVVRIIAHYPNDDGTYVNTTVLRREDMRNIGQPRQDQGGTWQVPVTVTDASAGDLSEAMTQAGFGGGSTCRNAGSNFTFDGVTQGDRCMVTMRDDEVVYGSGVAPGLGQQWQSGQFAADPSFVIQTGAGQESLQEARDLSIDLRAGSLPAPLAFDQGTTFQLEPALADRFKTNAFFTGIIAVIVVSLVVFARYGDPRVAVPMVVTAMSEVVILLGFAAAISLPLDLSHIAGFIAVIGTGADDLIIIADEVMSEGDVNSRRVFQNRFKKAFWVIGVAAATTIFAMGPLAVLSLGDLKGFAIITIIGVIIGVTITRPAYGDILRRLLTDR